MATKITLRHKASGVEKSAYYGFSWTTFLFGFWPALFRGDWLGFFGSLVIHVVLAFLTFGIGNIVFMLVMCFSYNGWHARRLLVAGYEFTGSQDEKERAARALNVARNVVFALWIIRSAHGVSGTSPDSVHSPHTTSTRCRWKSCSISSGHLRRPSSKPCE